MFIIESAILFTMTLVLGSPGDRIPSDVRENIAKRVDQGDCVGLVVGVVDADAEVYFSRGRASKVGEKPVNENTVFEIGSITKAFTGILLADMVEKGEVSLDDPVQKFLPASAKVPSRGDQQITLRHLTTHRSALPRLPDNLEPADPDNPYADYDEKRLLDFLAGHELSRDIGEKYEYSNLGAGLLGYALARKSGKSYEQLVLDRICTPLEMKDTRISLTGELQSRLAQGHADGKTVKNWDIDVLGGAGALRSTAKDMVRFLKANLGLMETPLAKSLHAAHREQTETGMSELSVALGWHIRAKHGTAIIWHNGGTGGYHSFCGFSPEKKLGVVVLTNSSTDIDDIGLHLLEPKYELKPPRTAIAVGGAALDDYLGYFELRPGLVTQITREGDQLYAQLSGQEKYPLYAESDTKFFFKVVDAQITFTRADDGKVHQFVLHQNGDHVAKRLSDYQPPIRREIELDSKVLAQYVGKYELAPGVGFDVKLEGSQLKAMLTGQPYFPVFPESETKFFYKVVEAQLTFVKDDSGKVTGLILHQGGVDQKARREP